MYFSQVVKAYSRSYVTAPRQSCHSKVSNCSNTRLLCRICLEAEDGTSYPDAQALIGSVKAVCTPVKLPNGQTNGQTHVHTLLIALDEHDASVLVCQPPDGDVCTVSGTYQVTSIGCPAAQHTQ